jgi:hypothetical protein
MRKNIMTKKKKKRGNINVTSLSDLLCIYMYTLPNLSYDPPSV